MKNAEKLIALHGAGMDAGAWNALSQHIKFKSLTLPGHDGGKTQPCGTIEDMAGWITQRLDGTGYILMGHSMGALAALEAAKHPSVAGLVLMGIAAKMPVHPDLLKQAKETPEAAADLVLKWGVFAEHPQADAIKTQLKTSMKNGLASLGGDLAACNAYQNGENAARTLQKPVLVIAGAKDKMTKASDGEALAKLMPQGRFHLLQDTGHMMMNERPLEIAALVTQFISDVSSH